MRRPALQMAALMMLIGDTPIERHLRGEAPPAPTPVKPIEMAKPQGERERARRVRQMAKLGAKR